MQYLIAVYLTFLAISFIIKRRGKKAKNIFSETIMKQSDIHNIMKIFFSRTNVIAAKKQSQMERHEDAGKIEVLIIEDKAYWVADNTFFTANMVNGFIDQETTRPINTENMEKKEIEKMLFILDNLQDGKNNDSGSTRN